MPGQIARGGRTVLLDHVEEPGAVGIALQRQLEVGILRLETRLRLGDHLRGLLGARRHDQRPVAVNQRGENQQPQKNVGELAPVLFEKEFRSVHCLAEAFRLGDVLLRHRSKRIF